MKPKASRRPKPQVAFESAAAAKRNLKMKLNLMLAALGQESEVTLPEDFDFLDVCPKTQRQFHLWEKKLLPALAQKQIPVFERSGPKTLAKYSELAISVADALSAVRARRIKAIAAPRSLETLAGLRNEIRELRLLRDIAMRELKDERGASARQRADYEGKLGVANNIQAAALRELASIREERDELRKRISQSPSAVSATVYSIGGKRGRKAQT